jgi:hypothetical protein
MSNQMGIVRADHVEEGAEMLGAIKGELVEPIETLPALRVELSIGEDETQNRNMLTDVETLGSGYINVSSCGQGSVVVDYVADLSR